MKNLVRCSVLVLALSLAACEPDDVVDVEVNPPAGVQNALENVQQSVQELQEGVQNAGEALQGEGE